jgi:CBS-domain-containing membrane protein
MLSSCTKAIVKDVVTATPNQTVEDILKVFKEKNIRNIPVLDDAGKFLGLFGLQQIAVNLLPKSAAMEDGVDNLNFIVGATPGIAKRLRKLHEVQIGELLNTKAATVTPETSTIEALLVLAKRGSPVAIIDDQTNEFKGVITRQTLLDNLYDVLDEIGNEDAA